MIFTDAWAVVGQLSIIVAVCCLAAIVIIKEESK